MKIYWLSCLSLHARGTCAWLEGMLRKCLSETFHSFINQIINKTNNTKKFTKQLFHCRKGKNTPDLKSNFQVQCTCASRRLRVCMGNWQTQKTKDWIVERRKGPYSFSQFSSLVRISVCFTCMSKEGILGKIHFQKIIERKKKSFSLYLSLSHSLSSHPLASQTHFLSPLLFSLLSSSLSPQTSDLRLGARLTQFPPFPLAHFLSLPRVRFASQLSSSQPLHGVVPTNLGFSELHQGILRRNSTSAKFLDSEVSRSSQATRFFVFVRVSEAWCFNFRVLILRFKWGTSSFCGN